MSEVYVIEQRDTDCISCVLGVFDSYLEAKEEFEKLEFWSDGEVISLFTYTLNKLEFFGPAPTETRFKTYD